MQYYALEKESRILAADAKRGTLYTCPECKQGIRMRSGPHRQPHFYHLKKDPHCRQHQKSLAHLQAQYRVSNILPAGEAFLEMPFPSIQRIADVAWPNQKIVYEVQCSPISLEEAKKRCEDYESQGYLPVWILHDKRYNQRKLTLAEHYLRTQCCFFTNIDDGGNGVIYDQRDYCQGYRRLHRGSKIPVDLKNPTLQAILPLQTPTKKKLSLSKLYQIFLRLLLESF